MYALFAVFAVAAHTRELYVFRKKEFGSGKYDFIIAGLGNPGAKYEMTRHNAGFLSMDLLSIEEGVDIKIKASRSLRRYDR